MVENASLKLLVVDDEPGIVDFVKKIYSRKGFLAFGATDGIAAVDIFERERPQICLIDVHMPYSPIDGIETLRRIKRIDSGAVCIMVSRITENEPVQQAKELGAFSYALKPLEAEDMDRFIQEAVDKLRGEKNG